MFDVNEINDIASLDSYRSQWHELLLDTPAATFFHTLDWLQVYWQHFGQNQSLRVLMVRQQDRLAGILPLTIRREQRRVGMVRVLTYPLDDWGSYYGPIGPQPAATLAAGLAHIGRTRHDWDLLDLRWAAEEAAESESAGGIMRSAGFAPRRSVRAQTAVIDLSGTFEQYLAQRTSKWRNNYRRWTRRLEEAGSTEYVRYRPAGVQTGGDPRWDIYDQCEQLAATSWQGASTDGTTLSHQVTRQFFRDAHAAAVRSGCLDLNLLSLDGDLIAFIYNYHWNGSIYSLRIGYDPQMSKLGPGNVLYVRMLEDSFRRGDRLFDMGPGSLECKRHLHSRIEPILQYTYHHPLSIRAQMMKWKKRTEDWWQQSPTSLVR